MRLCNGQLFALRFPLSMAMMHGALRVGFAIPLRIAGMQFVAPECGFVTSPLSDRGAVA